MTFLTPSPPRLVVLRSFARQSRRRIVRLNKAFFDIFLFFPKVLWSILLPRLDPSLFLEGAGMTSK